MLNKKVTLGVGTIGNTEALCLCLNSVLSGSVLPARIVVRSEGSFPSINNFNLEQLSELARIKGVEFLIAVIKSKGAREGCDWTMNNCHTPFLWLVDDDVVFEHRALEELLKGSDHAAEIGPWGFVCGNKRDVNNRRGYGDFGQEELDAHVAIKDYCSTNLYYSEEGGQVIVKCMALDTGHVLLNVDTLRFKGLGFAYFKEDFNCGGYDTFFGIRCTHSGFPGYFAHRSKCWHLEKQRQNFGEFSQRKAYLLRSAEAVGITDPSLASKIFNWVK